MRAWRAGVSDSSATRISHMVLKHPFADLKSIMPCRVGLCGQGPVFNFQVGHLPEYAIMTHENCLERQRVGGNLHVKFREGPASRKQRSFEFSMNRRYVGIPRECGHSGKEIFYVKAGARWKRPLGDPIAKFGGGNG